MDSAYRWFRCPRCGLGHRTVKAFLDHTGGQCQNWQLRLNGIIKFKGTVDQSGIKRRASVDQPKKAGTTQPIPKTAPAPQVDPRPSPVSCGSAQVIKQRNVKFELSADIDNDQRKSSATQAGTSGGSKKCGHDNSRDEESSADEDDFNYDRTHQNTKKQTQKRRHVSDDEDEDLRQETSRKKFVPGKRQEKFKKPRFQKPGYTTSKDDDEVVMEVQPDLCRGANLGRKLNHQLKRINYVLCEPLDWVMCDPCHITLRSMEDFDIHLQEVHPGREKGTGVDVPSKAVLELQKSTARSWNGLGSMQYIPAPEVPDNNMKMFHLKQYAEGFRRLVDKNLLLAAQIHDAEIDKFNIHALVVEKLREALQEDPAAIEKVAKKPITTNTQYFTLNRQLLEAVALPYERKKCTPELNYLQMARTKLNENRRAKWVRDGYKGPEPTLFAEPKTLKSEGLNICGFPGCPQQFRWMSHGTYRERHYLEHIEQTYERGTKKCPQCENEYSEATMMRNHLRFSHGASLRTFWINKYMAGDIDQVGVLDHAEFGEVEDTEVQAPKPL